MPSFHDVRRYLYGIWLLIKGDPRGMSLLDTSERGMWQSFWAILWCLPAYIGLWPEELQSFREAYPDSLETTSSFIAKSALLDVLEWLSPIGGVFVVLTLLKQRSRLFNALVVSLNWWSVVVLSIGTIILLIMNHVPDPTSENGWTFWMIGIFAVFAGYLAFLLLSMWRILRIVVGGRLWQRLAVFAGMSLPIALLGFLEKPLGIYIP